MEATVEATVEHMVEATVQATVALPSVEVLAVEALPMAFWAHKMTQGKQRHL